MSDRGAIIQKFVRLPVAWRQSLQWSMLNIGRRMSPWPPLVEAGHMIDREESAGTASVYRKALQLHPPWRAKGASEMEDILESV